jgi:hypothetical protein
VIRNAFEMRKVDQHCSDLRFAHRPAVPFFNVGDIPSENLAFRSCVPLKTQMLSSDSVCFRNSSCSRNLAEMSENIYFLIFFWNKKYRAKRPRAATTKRNE